MTEGFGEGEEARIELGYEVGDRATIIEGAFSGSEGKISEINYEHKKVKVMIDVFGRMTPVEVDKHLNPMKYMTDEQLFDIYVKSLKPLTRRQFKLVLLDNDLLDGLETAISNIEDTTEKKRIEIEYTESDKFARTSESVKTMFALINQTEEQINELWEKALAL